MSFRTFARSSSGGSSSNIGSFPRRLLKCSNHFFTRSSFVLPFRIPRLADFRPVVMLISCQLSPCFLLLSVSLSLDFSFWSCCCTCIVGLLEKAVSAFCTAYRASFIHGSSAILLRLFFFFGGISFSVASAFAWAK